ncbi:hypothetical protein VNO77_19740 [Canavalia gladiata]|uniref:Uncharacterized protein n=1 Tax=Canavalia gladiata TaxID=3824 RepID=A0AAN9LS41_CANGL
MVGSFIGLEKWSDELEANCEKDLEREKKYEGILKEEAPLMWLESMLRLTARKRALHFFEGSWKRLVASHFKSSVPVTTERKEACCVVNRRKKHQIVSWKREEFRYVILPDLLLKNRIRSPNKHRSVTTSGGDAKLVETDQHESRPDSVLREVLHGISLSTWPRGSRLYGINIDRRLCSSLSPVSPLNSHCFGHPLGRWLRTVGVKEGTTVVKGETETRSAGAKKPEAQVRHM